MLVFLLVQDLLGHLQHYNTTVRHSGLMGLKELLSAHPVLINQYLFSLLTRVAETFIDKDQVIRKAVIGVMHIILSHVSIDQISPFISVMAAHLCCAMTHISDDIRLDSLQLLDVYLEFFPHQLAKSSLQILQNFLEMFSQKGSNTKDAKGNSTNARSRALMVNPSSKLSMQKWRVNILEKITKFIKAYMGKDVKDATGPTNLYKCARPVERKWSDQEAFQVLLFNGASSFLNRNLDFSVR